MIQIMAAEKRKNKLQKEKGLNLKKTIEYRKQNERLDNALQKQLCLRKAPRSHRGRPRKSYTGEDGKISLEARFLTKLIYLLTDMTVFQF